MKKALFLLVVLAILLSASFVSAGRFSTAVRWISHNVSEAHITVENRHYSASIDYYGRQPSYNYYVTSYAPSYRNTYYVPPQTYYAPSAYYPRNYYYVYSGYGGYSGPVVAYD
ncbi:MAG: hypothetical protein PHD95_04440 [Candidatus ainarchaeum sp.]|nr:hypothetical protein [Candidatus ainarchaeum sp.]